MPEDFSKNLIKEYKYWQIYINANQSYLGRCVVYCKRPDALDLADATPEEQQELFIVLHDLREATKKVFQADWFNYFFLGNIMRHPYFDLCTSMNDATALGSPDPNQLVTFGH